MVAGNSYFLLLPMKGLEAWRDMGGMTCVCVCVSAYMCVYVCVHVYMRVYVCVQYVCYENLQKQQPSIKMFPHDARAGFKAGHEAAMPLVVRPPFYGTRITVSVQSLEENIPGLGSVFNRQD